MARQLLPYERKELPEDWVVKNYSFKQPSTEFSPLLERLGNRISQEGYGVVGPQHIFSGDIIQAKYQLRWSKSPAGLVTVNFVPLTDLKVREREDPLGEVCISTFERDFSRIYLAVNNIFPLTMAMEKKQ